MSIDQKSLERALSAADFPAGKEQLVAAAEEQEAGEDILRALRGLPPVRYDNVAEIVQSVRTGEERSTSEQARQARRHTSGLAERETDVAANPIEEELGENRGS